MKHIIITAGLIICTLTSFGQRHTQKDQSKKLNGITLLVGGIAFSTAAILEGSKGYQTYGMPATTTMPTLATNCLNHSFRTASERIGFLQRALTRRCW